MNFEPRRVASQTAEGAPNAAAAALAAAPPRPRVPQAAKFVFTTFCAILVERYLQSYGPTNFLYFCDQTLLMTLVGIWIESPLIISMAAVGIIAPQLVWVADFLATACGHPLLGMTGYMFDAHVPLQLRVLSSFHGWLPFLLIFLLTRVGYDPRALRLWTGWAIATLLVCFFLMPPPRVGAGLTPVNINYVWGMSDTAPQTWMPPFAWLMLLIVGLPLVLFLPTHLALRRWMPRAVATQAIR